VREEARARPSCLLLLDIILGNIKRLGNARGPSVEDVNRLLNVANVLLESPKKSQLLLAQSILLQSWAGAPLRIRNPGPVGLPTNPGRALA
jgi:hypothetical protein